MAFNPTNPVVVGAATKKDHYDRVFDNSIALRQMLYALAAFGVPFDRVGPSEYRGVDGVYASTATATIATIAGSAVVGIAFVTITNNDTVARVIRLYAVENGGSVSDAKLVHIDGSMAARSTICLPIPILLDPNDTIRCYADADNVVSVRVDLLELTTVPSGITFTVIDGATITPTTDTTLYTCPASTRAVVVGMSHSNNNGASRYVLDSAPAAGAQNRLFADTLPDKQSAHWGGPIVLDPDDVVVAHHEASSIGARLGVVEFAL